MTPAIIYSSLLLNAQRWFSFLRNHIFYYPSHGFWLFSLVLVPVYSAL